MSAFEPETNLPRQIAHALDDHCSQPLGELEEHAPEVSVRFSEFERTIGDWGFGYGVAWALARVRDPFMSSEKVAAVAQAAAREAWRSHTGYEFWPALVAGNGKTASPEGAAASAPGTQLDAFMQRLGALRTREPAPEG